MHQALRLTDPEVVRLMLELYGASTRDGLLLSEARRSDLADLGVAEIFTLYVGGRRRVRLTPLGRRIVDTLIHPKEK